MKAILAQQQLAAQQAQQAQQAQMAQQPPTGGDTAGNGAARPADATATG
jgi:hypothetical protein